MDLKLKYISLIFIFYASVLLGQNTQENTSFLYNKKIASYDSIINKSLYNNPIKTLDFLLNILENNKNTLDNTEKALLYSKLRYIYSLTHDPYNALLYGYKALFIFKLYNLDKHFLNELLSIASIYRSENIYDGFILNFIEKAIDKYQNNYPDYIPALKANHSFLCKISNKKLIYNVDSIFTQIHLIKDTNCKINSYISLANYFFIEKKYSKAIATIKKSIFITKSPTKKIRLNLLLAELYFKQRNITSSDKILDKSYSLILSNNDVIAQAQWYLQKAQVKFFQNDIKQATLYAQKGLRIAVNNDILGIQAKLYKILSQLYLYQQKSDLAFMSFNNYTQIKDSIYSLNKFSQLHNILQKLASVDIIQENVILKEQAQYEKLKNQQQKLITIIFALSALFLTLLLILVYNLFKTSYKSEQRLKRFAQISQEAIIILDKKQIVEFNDKFLNLTGYKNHEIKNLKLQDLIDPILASKIFETNDFLNFETYLKRKNGTQIKAEIISRKFVYSSRKIIKVISIRDVTDFYNAQKEFIESQIKFKTLIDTSPDGVIITDINTKINFISQSAKNILGLYNTKKFIGKNLSELINISNKIKILLSNQSKSPLDFIHSLEVNNEIKYLETKLSLVKSIDNEPIAIFIILRDATQKIKIQEALKQSEQKFRELYNSATDGILLVDNQGKIVDANPASEKIFGLSPKYLKKLSLENFFPITFPSPMLFKEFISSKEKIEIPIIQADGNTIYAQISVAKLKQMHQSYMLIIRDITKLIKTQEQLKKYSEKLEISNNSKAKLFSIIAHDLRGPIGNLKAMIELILENPISFNINEIKDILTELKNSSVSTYELLENLLYWSRAQLNQIEYNPKNFDISIIIEQTINILTHMAKQKNIEIINKIQAKKHFVKADIEMVKIILRNLISNAIKFTPKGGKISLLNFEDKNSVIISVKDTGIGIAYDKLSKIFENDNFYTTYGTENEKGTGIGLQIVKEFVAINKGKLWVESELGKGTTFYFSLPKINT